MHVNIYADEWFFAGDAENQISALGADTSQRQQHFLAAGQSAAVLLNGDAGDVVYLLRFGFVKSAFANQFINLCGASSLICCGVRATAKRRLL
jgi:hypothetical protein